MITSRLSSMALASMLISSGLLAARDNGLAATPSQSATTNTAEPEPVSSKADRCGALVNVAKPKTVVANHSPRLSRTTRRGRESMSNPDVLGAYRRPLFRMPDWRRMQERLADKIVRFGLRLVPEDNLIRHARTELKIAGLFDADSIYGGTLGESTINLMKLFALEGHSGYSAGMQTSLFQKVSRFEPLTPLTGADSEWMEVYEGTFQNVRCSHVFKDSEHGVYDIQGRVFREPSGATFTSGDSRTPVTFPYTPTSEIVDVPASA